MTQRYQGMEISLHGDGLRKVFVNTIAHMAAVSYIFLKSNFHLMKSLSREITSPSCVNRIDCIAAEIKKHEYRFPCSLL